MNLCTHDSATFLFEGVLPSYDCCAVACLLWTTLHTHVRIRGNSGVLLAWQLGPLKFVLSANGTLAALLSFRYETSPDSAVGTEVAQNVNSSYDHGTVNTNPHLRAPPLSPEKTRGAFLVTSFPKIVRR